MGAQTDFIKQSIMELIQSGELKPGDPILEKEICARFKSSRTPFREAVLQLETVDIVERRPRAGVFVKYPPFRELVERMEMHAELEGTVAALAARRANPKQVANMKRLVEAYERAAKKAERQNNTNIYDLNLEFHREILQASGNQCLMNQIELSGTVLVGFFRARHSALTHVRKSSKEHREMLDAILDADGARARELTYKHVVVNAEELLDIANILASG